VLRLSQSLMLLAVPATLLGQGDASHAGRWGAEALSNHAANLIRFRNDASAWIIGTDIEHQREGSSSPFAGKFTYVNARIGLRRYARLGEKNRPFRTLSVTASYQGSGSASGLGFGAAGEFGVAHFFNENVSLGASSEASATILHRRYDSGTVVSLSDSWAFHINAVRVIAAVFF
jgi:hypothetical protein